MADARAGGPGEGGGKGSLFGESIRKVLATGLSAVLMTEEGIRAALADMRLPKDAVSFLVQQTGNTRREILRIVSEELGAFLRNTDAAAVIRAALAGMKVEVKAEIRFVEQGAELERVTVEGAAAETARDDSPHAKRGRRRS